MLAIDHLPPDTNVFHRLDPTGVFDFTGFVQVENQIGGEDIAGIIADHDGAPRRHAWCLKMSLVALGIGCEPRLKYHVLVVEIEVHARIVDQRSLVDVDVESVGCLHLE